VARRVTDDSSAEIHLARAPSFRLGKIEVRPATREVVAPERREVLEPRVMQVLVALARRPREVVSKDDLVMACWGGRVVGEDAIQRCIARLRRLAAELGGFEIETVARVGYRLSEVAGARSQSPPRALAPARLSVVAASALLIVLALGAAWLGWRRLEPPASTPPPRIAVAPFRLLAGGAEAAAFTASVDDELIGVLSQASIRTTASPARTGDLSLAGTVYEDGGVVRMSVRLDDPRSRVTLWSAQFQRPIGETAALRDMVAGAAAEAIYAAFEPLQQKAARLDPAALALFIQGERGLENPQYATAGEPLRTLAQAAALAPQSATVHGHLAMALQAASYQARAVSDADSTKLEQRARDEAARAIRADPAQAGAAYDALYFLETKREPQAWGRREDLILQGVARAPDFPFIQMRECRFLQQVGRPAEGLGYCQSAVALRPLAEPPAFSYARALFLTGRTDLALQQLARVIPFHPDHFFLQAAWFDIEAFSDSPANALKILRAPGAPQNPGSAALALMLQARTNHAPRHIDAAMQALWTTVRQRQLDPRYLVMSAAALGRIDDAFKAIDEFQPSLDPDQGYLFEPVTAPLRRDPRFWRIAAHLGLVRYWRQRGVWPDFCSDRTLAIDCEKAARAAQA
jgi:DNA-binding winged helix-turn-helix (wHTH) protein/TolB-like protein